MKVVVATVGLAVASAGGWLIGSAHWSFPAVLVAALLHGSLNAYGDGLGATKRFVTDHTLLTSPGGAIAMGIFALIAAGAYAMRGRRRSIRTQ